MGGEFKSKPLGPMDAIKQRLSKIERQLKEMRGAAVVRNSAITGGDGITIGGLGASGVKLWIQTAIGSSGLYPRMDFQSADDTVAPASVYMSDTWTSAGDSGIDSNLKLRSVGNGARSPSLILMAAGGIDFFPDQLAPPQLSLSSSGAGAKLAGWTFGDTTVDAPANSLRFQAASGEWQAKNTSGAFVALRAASFPVSSSRAAKQNISSTLPFDPLAVIKAAKLYGWEYRAEMGGDTERHYFPMADDLPAALVNGDGAEMSVEVRDMLGVVWGAVAQLASRRLATVGQAATPATIAIGASQDITIPLAQAMSDTAYDVAVTAPAGFTPTVKSTSKNAVVVTLKATLAITGAGTVSVMVTAR